jgi:hypothetical protein
MLFFKNSTFVLYIELRFCVRLNFAITHTISVN